MNINKVILTGNLTAEPELYETPNGATFCKFNIAVNREFQNADGVNECDFFKVMTWNKLAESCSTYLTKGSKVAVVGRLQNRTYEDKDGNNRTITEIVASQVEFLTPMSSKKDEEDIVEEPTEEIVKAKKVEKKTSKVAKVTKK